jgi:hypothetical protein
VRPWRRLHSFQVWKQSEVAADVAQRLLHGLLRSTVSPTQEQLGAVNQLRRAATQKLCVLAHFQAVALAARPQDAMHHVEQLPDERALRYGRKSKQRLSHPRH